MADTLDRLEIALQLHEASGDKTIRVEVKMLRWLLTLARGGKR